MYKIIAIKKIILPSVSKNMEIGETITFESLTEQQLIALKRASEIGLIKFLEIKNVNVNGKVNKKNINKFKENKNFKPFEAKDITFVSKNEDNKNEDNKNEKMFFCNECKAKHYYKSKKGKKHLKYKINNK